MEEALVDGVEDIEYDAEVAEVYTEPTMLAGVREALRARGLRISDDYLGMRAEDEGRDCEGGELARGARVLEALDEHEDVQRVFSNLDFSRDAGRGRSPEVALRRRTCRAIGFSHRARDLRRGGRVVRPPDLRLFAPLVRRR